jgi:hypothetical protein
VCPDVDVRLGSWYRYGRPTRARRPRPSWEAVLYVTARDAPWLDAGEDGLVYGVAPRTTDPRRVIGAKPPPFAYWMFGLLGALPGDDFHDLFPGSGGISRAWGIFESRAA